MEYEKEKTTVRFIARHASGHGSGHFQDKGFETIEEAQSEIDRNINGVKTHDHTQTVDDEYKEYWKTIGENMYITIQTIVEVRV